MLKIKQMVSGVVTGMDKAHNGLLRIGKDIVLMRHVLKQEEVRVRIIRRIAKGYISEVVEIERVSPFRKPVKCPTYEHCGNYQLLHMNAQGQHVFKNQSMQALYDRAKGMKLQMEDIVMMEEPWQYRNKVIIGFQKDRQR